MVSKKRLHYGGFDCFRAPVVPKAPRSIRRNSHKISSTGTEICAFELLAAVAGKLLQESEGSASSTGPKDGVKKEPLEDLLKPARLEDLDHGCCAESEFIPKPPNLESPLKDSLQSDNDSGLEHASIITTSEFIKEINTNVKLEASDMKNGDLCDVNMDTNRADAVEKQTEDLQDTKKTSVLNKSCSSVHVPFYSDPVPSACFLRRRGSNVKIGIRDDDENSFSCNHHSTKLRAFRSQSRSGYRRIRKMLNAKYWKSAPKLKDYEVSNTTNGGVKPSNHKRRKLFHHSLKRDYVQEASSESISNLPEISASGDKRHPLKREREVTSSFQSKDGHVKFSIKSFKVPELYLEMPETSTVGSLKRTVMEAVTAILGGELHLGVFLQGKKVKDDNRTLQQTGISLNSDTLGFMLEPSLPESQVQNKPPLSPEADNNEPILKCPEVPFTDMSLADTPPENNESQPESTEEIVADTKAIVPITSVNPDALSIVPLNKKSELSQRRTRRPFSVSEVEGLVEAVETLGTGRWRDVKIRAFDDANHRTYVDLKDKWKTLVHTASISPQQRRGEPVPQDLLDRVLAAHAFWSQHQSKQHVKQQSESLGTPVKLCLELEG